MLDRCCCANLGNNRSRLRRLTKSLETGCKKKFTHHRVRMVDEASPVQDALVGKHVDNCPLYIDMRQY